MRADRLLSLMMLLQARGQMTAEELAAELEVSKRTIYRDIDALSASGVPVYANGGPGGGYALLDSYRASLTGLNEQEIQALFLLSLPGPLTDLGQTQQLKSTLLKVTSNFSARYESQANQLRNRLYLDPARWFGDASTTPWLARLQEAVWTDRKVAIHYRRGTGARLERTVEPYSLVGKAGIWYVVAAHHAGLRVYRVDRVQRAVLLEETFVRPSAFNLIEYWTRWTADYEAMLPSYPVVLRISPQLMAELPHILSAGILQQLADLGPEADGWYRLNYTFERLEEARMVVLGMGAGVQIVAPEELRTSVVEYAAAALESHRRES